LISSIEGATSANEIFTRFQGLQEDDTSVRNAALKERRRRQIRKEENRTLFTTGEEEPAPIGVRELVGV